MKNSLNDSVSGDLGSFEETLWLIANAPVPEGLADRVQARLDANSAVRLRKGSVLAWPVALAPGSNWMRAAAAAAIVFVVAGGGWGVYSRVQPLPAARNVVPQPRTAVPGGMSTAGAMRTPQTLNGPMLTHSESQPSAGNPAVKASAPLAQKPAHRAKTALASKAAPQLGAPAAK